MAHLRALPKVRHFSLITAQNYRPVRQNVVARRVSSPSKCEGHEAFLWNKDKDFIGTLAGWWIISLKFVESVSKMCKRPSNSNNGPTHEQECEWVECWKGRINLIWRQLVGLLMFVVSSPLLSHLCTLQTQCPPWLRALSGWKLDLSVLQRGWWERIPLNPLCLFTFSLSVLVPSVPLSQRDTQPVSGLCNPLSSNDPRRSHPWEWGTSKKC